MLVTFSLLLLTVLSKTTPGAPSPPPSRRLSTDELVKIIDSCPTYPEMADAAYKSCLKRDNPAFSIASKELDLAMRRLQPESTASIREALAYVDRRWIPDTPENLKAKKEIKDGHPNWDGSEIDRAFEGVRKKNTVTIWVDRFLFDAPQKELSTDPVSFVGIQTLKDGYVNRLYPVEINKSGEPCVMFMFVYWGPNGGRFLPLKEFDYYASHYPRRKPWWKAVP